MTRMKGGKDEEKQLDPLFPRIHVNDAEKGGPRAPPRNKMALCEQLTMPCNSFTPGSMSSMLPRLPTTTPALPPPPPSSSSSPHVGHHKKSSKFSPFCTLPELSDLAIRPRAHASGGVNLKTPMTKPEARSMVPIPPFGDTGRKPRSTENNNPFQPCSFLRTRNSTAERTREPDFPRVPSFVHIGRGLTHGNAGEKMEDSDKTLSCSNSTVKFQAAHEKQLKERSCGDFKDLKYTGKQTEEKCEVTEGTGKLTKNFDSVQSTEERIITEPALGPRDKKSEPQLDAMSKQVRLNCELSGSSENCTKIPNSVLSTEEKFFKDVVPEERNNDPGTSATVSTNHKKSSLLDVLSRLHNPLANSHHGLRSLQEKNASGNHLAYLNPETITRKRSASTMESSIQQPGDKHENKPASVNDCSKYQDSGSVRVGIIDRSDGTSDTSVVDSIAGFVVSPDDVVGIMGQKHFWKARRTILHQQRIFAMQIFELHRLIKVQKLIAESPEMLFEGNFYFSKSPVRFSPTKKLINRNIREPSSLPLHAKPDPPKPNLHLEGTAENGFGKPPPLEDTEKQINNLQQPSTPKPRSQQVTTPPTSMDVKFAPLFLQPPPGNQWLIPVRSPSEGLIYKPYTGPCPPPGGILAPVYGGYGPINLSGGAGNLLSTPYCVSAPNQHVIGNYSSHAPFYGMPVVNATDSNSTVERISGFAKPQPAQQDSSMPIIAYQNSCNISSQKQWIMSESSKQLQGCKESDLQRSSATSPTERNEGDALPLFPTTPSIPVCSPRSEQPIQVIKVVPHSRTSASESAARIFQAIQEERKKQELSH